MKVKEFSEVEKNFTKTAEEVLRDHIPIIITGISKQPVVMMSLEDFTSYEETVYLTRNPKNKKRLFESLENIKNKKYKPISVLTKKTSKQKVTTTKKTKVSSPLIKKSNAKNY